MHELSLIGSVLRIMEEQAVAEHFQRVISVCLGVGELSNVESEALVFCFGIARRGSLAHNAKLSVQTIPGEAWCEKCERSVHIALRTDACPSCGLWGLSVTDGDQVTVIEVEVE
jgi:hydrogenase nickel incorporation protein HypA/HybF